jgi:hypothetical protein
LAEQSAQLVACVPATAAVEQLCDRDVGEPEGIIEFTVREQADVGSDPGTVEFKLDPAIENGSQRRLFGFTRRVLHDRIPSPASSQRFIIKIGRWRHQRSSHLGNPSETIAADRVVTGPRLDRGDPQVNRLLQ